MSLDSELLHLLMSISISGQLEEIVLNVNPSKKQYGIKPGDKTLLVTTTSTEFAMDDYRALNLVEVLDPELFKNSFPDYEARLQNSWVLGRHYSSASVNDGGDLGWFGRVELCDVDDEHYAAAFNWLSDKDVPTEMPQWLMDKYIEFSDAVADSAPEKVARPAACNKCKSRKVMAHLKINQTASVHAGTGQTPDGERIYMAVSDYETSRVTEIHLHCDDCGYVMNIPPERYVVPKLRSSLRDYSDEMVDMTNWPA